MGMFSSPRPKDALTDEERALISKYLKRHKVTVIPNGVSGYSDDAPVTARQRHIAAMRKPHSERMKRRRTYLCVLIAAVPKGEAYPSLDDLLLKINSSPDTLVNDFRELVKEGKLAASVVTYYNAQLSAMYKKRRSK